MGNMHAFLHFLVLILASSLIFQLPYTSIAARKLTSTNGIFSIDLIHRDSLHSIASSNSSLTTQVRQGWSPLGSVSHHHHISLSSTIYKNKNVQTTIIPNGGDYLLKFAVGTPPFEYTAVADTGSDLVWIQCAPCSRCIAQDSPLFNPKKSSTYSKAPCTSQFCNQQGVQSGCKSGSCTYVAQYGDGTTSAGIINTEIISFPSSNGGDSSSFQSFAFGCGFNQNGQLGTHGDGIAGLGAGALSLVSQLSSNIDYKFSYCLTPFDSGVNSKLSFGQAVTRRGVVSTPFTNQDTFYTLELDSITVGDTSVPVSSFVIIDSGTTLTYLPSDVYDGVRTAVKGAITLTTVDDPNQVFDPCYDSSSMGDGFSPPDVVFHFSGADVVLKAENVFRKSDSVTCLAIVATDDIPIFGNIAQVNFEVGYDLQAQQVSFAPADCTNY